MKGWRGGGGYLSYLTEAFFLQANILDENWAAGLKTVEDRF
jgi:hypothetical protein